MRNLGVGPISVIAKTFGHGPALVGAYINQPYQARSAEGCYFFYPSFSRNPTESLYLVQSADIQEEARDFSFSPSSFFDRCSTISCTLLPALVIQSSPSWSSFLVDRQPQPTMAIPPTSVPDFDDLPKVENMPPGYAWGVFDRDGKKDVLGTLNFLTPDIVQASSKEVKDGVSISLNWSLNAMAKIPIPGRGPPEHRIDYKPDTMGSYSGISWDDHLSFNTQSSSQWDSLCHFQHQPSGLAYNGYKPTKDSLAAASSATSQDAPTIDHWHSRGGLVARGVLIDYKAYTEDKGISFHAFDGTSISPADLEACAAHQGVEFRPGDVLIVRTGSTQIIDHLSPEQIQQTMGAAALAGVEGSENTARWLWNKRFAAVASDSNAFEVFPPVKPDGSKGSPADLVLHHYLLSGFGMPIGELWDLTRLSAYCREKKRYSFMLTSAPLNHPGLIGSPPNALAIL